MALQAALLLAVCLVSASSVSAQLNSSLPVTPTLELQAGRVIPDVINGLASSPANMSVTYTGGNVVGYGNELTVTQALVAPTINVTNGTNSTSLYTLILSDPDTPDPSTAVLNTSFYLHWLVVNISGTARTNITSAGVALAPYQTPAPPSGLHRYVFQLYKQNATTIIPNQTITRSGFNPKAFASVYNLGLPIASLYFRAEPLTTNLTLNTTPSVVEVQQLVKGRVIPQVVPLFTPLAQLNVTYGTVGSLSYGQILTPPQVALAPSVIVKGLTNGTIYNSTYPYFTLMIVDPDAPSPTYPTSADILHFLKVNIPTNTPTLDVISTPSGNVLQAYRSPSPPSGLHRYTFLLFGQGRISNATAPTATSGFNATGFALNNTLGSPLAAFYFNSETPASLGLAPGPAPGPAPAPAPAIFPSGGGHS